MTKPESWFRTIEISAGLMFSENLSYPKNILTNNCVCFYYSDDSNNCFFMFIHIRWNIAKKEKKKTLSQKN